MMLAMMPLEDRDRWAARIDWLAAGRRVRGERKLRGARDLYRLEHRGWVLLYRRPARGRRLTIASLRLRRPGDLVDELLGRA
jgi:hypothetical protein